MKYLIGGAFAMVAMVLALNTSTGGEKKITNKQIMAKVMKDAALQKKLLSGSATAEEKKMVLEHVTAMVSNAPNKGDQAEFKAKAEALVAAAKAGDPTLWKAAANCAACHKAHK